MNDTTQQDHYTIHLGISWVKGGEWTLHRRYKRWMSPPSSLNHGGVPTWPVWLNGVVYLFLYVTYVLDILWILNLPSFTTEIYLNWKPIVKGTRSHRRDFCIGSLTKPFPSLDYYFPVCPSSGTSHVPGVISQDLVVRRTSFLPDPNKGPWL